MNKEKNKEKDREKERKWRIQRSMCRIAPVWLAMPLECHQILPVCDAE